MGKRICLVSISKHFTFQETVLNLKKNIDLNEKDDIVSVITSSTKSYELENEDELVFRTDYKYTSFNPFHHLKSIKEIVKFILNFKPTHLIFINVHPLNLYLSKKFKKKVSVYNIIHDVIPHKGDKNCHMIEMYNKAICKRTNYIILHNLKDIVLFSQINEFPNEHIKTTELWREYEPFEPYKESCQILFFGRVNPYKGVHYIKQMAERLPKFEFLIVGRWDQTMIEEKESFAKVPNIKVIDEIIPFEKMSEFFYNSALVIIPYTTATQSGVIIDAYKYSRPVVAFNVGAIREQVEDQKTGYLIEEGNIDALIDAMRNYLNLSLEFKMKLAHGAWEFGYQKYSTQVGYKRLLDLLD